MRSGWCRLAGLLFSITVCACAAVRDGAALSPFAQISFEETRFPSGGRAPFGVAIADLNGDGPADLAITITGDNVVATFFGKQKGGFVPGARFPVGEVARGVAAGDLNRDGQVDLVVVSAQSTDITILIGDGRGGFRASTARAGIAPFNSDICDLDGDGAPDIVVANETNTGGLNSPGDLSVLSGDGRGGFPRREALRAGIAPADVKCADLNGDGRLDIAAVSWASQAISVFLGGADGRLSTAQQFAYGGDPAYSLAVADLDGDRRPDIVTGDLSGKVFVMANQGGDAFPVAQTLAARKGVRSVIAADLNRDNRLDLVTANTSADSVTVFIGIAGGFAPPVHLGVGRGPRNVAAGDLNGDGWIDLVVTNGRSDDVSVLMNRTRVP